MNTSLMISFKLGAFVSPESCYYAVSNWDNFLLTMEFAIFTFLPAAARLSGFHFFLVTGRPVMFYCAVFSVVRDRPRWVARRANRKTGAAVSADQS